MGDFEEPAREYASQFTADPSELMVERLDIAAQEYIAGLSTSETEKQQTEMLKWITKVPPFWKLGGWRQGMPGVLSTRAAKAVPLLRRGRGRHQRNWPAEKFVEHMIDVNEIVEPYEKPKAPTWDNRKRCYTETSFSRICDHWLAIVAPGAKISPQTYRDILEALE